MTSTVLASGADERYGDQLLNMIGSVKRNADVFDAIVAFDLGLSPRQRTALERIHGVDVRTVPPFVPHWAQGRTWKPWIWTHVDADRLLWLDAGLTVLRPLDDVLGRIDERDYFAVSQGHPISDSIPQDWYDELDFPRQLATRDAIAAGIFGFAPQSEFYERVVVPAYDDCVQGRSLGYSADELAGKNIGIEHSPSPIVRDCKHFRWDQSVLNVRFYLGVDEPVVDDLDRFAGWRSRRDHPQQVIWSHRREGDLKYAGSQLRARWWFKRHRRFFTLTTYRLKAKRIARALR